MSDAGNNFTAYVDVGTLTPCPHKNCIAIFVNGTSGKPSPTEMFVCNDNVDIIGCV